MVLILQLKDTSLPIRLKHKSQLCLSRYWFHLPCQGKRIENYIPRKWNLKASNNWSLHPLKHVSSKTDNWDKEGHYIVITDYLYWSYKNSKYMCMKQNCTQFYKRKLLDIKKQLDLQETTAKGVKGVKVVDGMYCMREE